MEGKFEVDLPWTAEQVAEAAQTRLEYTRQNWPLCYNVFKSWGFTHPLDLVGLIGTIAKETASTFAPVREGYYIYSQDPIEAERLFALNPEPAYAWYRNTLKHAAYSGGPQYHGRGFIQTTHDYNYAQVESRTGRPVVANPDLLLTDATLSAEAMCIYWNNRSITAMCLRRDWLGVRWAVFGGTDQDGANRMARIAQVLGV